MTDKRFKVDYEVGVLDTLTDEIICDCQGSAEEVVELLNNQAETITHLEEECGARENDITILQKTIQTQQIRIYCQDKEITKLLNQLGKIPDSIKEVWLE